MLKRALSQRRERRKGWGHWPFLKLRGSFSNYWSLLQLGLHPRTHLAGFTGRGVKHELSGCLLWTSKPVRWNLTATSRDRWKFNRGATEKNRYKVQKRARFHPCDRNSLERQEAYYRPQYAIWCRLYLWAVRSSLAWVLHWVCNFVEESLPSRLWHKNFSYKLGRVPKDSSLTPFLPLLEGQAYQQQLDVCLWQSSFWKVL